MFYAFFALIIIALLLLMRQTFSQMDNWRSSRKN